MRQQQRQQQQQWQPFTRNFFELNYRKTAGLFWALFCGLTFFALSQIYPKMTQPVSRVQIRKRVQAMKALKPVSFGHPECIGKKAKAKEANWVSAKCAIAVAPAIAHLPIPRTGCHVVLDQGTEIFGALGAAVAVQRVVVERGCFSYVTKATSGSAVRCCVVPGHQGGAIS
jgi:hypothetical protein